jgi:hypothetical protein
MDPLQPEQPLRAFRVILGADLRLAVLDEGPQRQEQVALVSDRWIFLLLDATRLA